MRQHFQSLKEANKLEQCRLDKDCANPSLESSGFFRVSSNTKPRVIVHNPLPEDRFWCGKRILGDGGTIEIDDFPGECEPKHSTATYVNVNHPPLFSGSGVPSGGPPIELFWNTPEMYSLEASQRAETIQCPIPCRSTGAFEILNTINVRNTKWEVALTMEGEQYYSEAHVRQAAYRDGRFYATTSFKSEIPVPYYSNAEYMIQNPPVDFQTAIKGASFLANNCASQNGREEVVKNLTQSDVPLRVDSLSECLHNAEPPSGVDMANKTNVLRKYLFHLAFENQRSDDYITEKVWGALESGTLPVYFGAPNIKEHVPEKSIVVVDDFESVDDLAQYLVRLANNKILYESYHQWRYQPMDETFANKYAFTDTHSTCRICKWAYATRHGLPWDQPRQEVAEPYIAHKTCRNKVGLIGHPFKEYWISGNGAEAVSVTSEDVTKTCKLTTNNRDIDVDKGALRRKVFDHDGVTDLVIDMERNGNYVLKLETPIVAAEMFELDENVRWLQDSQSRMTVLVSDRNIKPSMTGKGAVQLEISSSVRIRVIAENLDHFHKGTKKIPSYFGDLMARDFLASMVEIRRVQPRRLGSKTTSGSLLSSLFSLRNVILALVALQGVRMLMGSFRDTSSPSSVQQQQPSHALSLEDRLKDSSGHVRKKQPPPKQPNKETPAKLKQQVEEEGDEKDDDDDEKLLNKDSEKEDPVHHEDPDLPPDEHEHEHHGGSSSNNNKNNNKSNDKQVAAGPSGNGLNPIVVDKKETGPTNVGYVKDFIHERNNPHFRSVEISLTDASPAVATLVQEKSVKPCDTISQDGKSVTNPSCLDQDTPLIAYNPETFSRTWCGQEIKPKSAVTMSEHCTDPYVHLFPAEVPPISGEHMPPIVIKSKSRKELKPENLETVECDIPCQQEKDSSGDTRFVDNEPWSIHHTMADGWYESSAKMERRDFMHDKFFSTQSWQSSVPLTYFSFDKHNLRDRPAVDFDSAKSMGIYIVNDQCSAAGTKRSKYYNAMIGKIKVDSYGQCAHSAAVPEGMSIDTQEGRIALMKQYRIVLAFDTTKSKDHISDLIWEALMSGSVPVVLGADNLRDHLPPDSFISASQHSSWDDLAVYVAKVINDKQLWESYQKWRNDEDALAAFEAKYEFTRTNPVCRLCRWAYAKKYGLGWDHDKQQIRSMRVPREKFCASADHGLITKPFTEMWVSKSGNDEQVLKEDADGEVCSSLTTDGDVDVDSFKGHRKVIQHDGVTDFIISDIRREHIDTEVVLRLGFSGVRNPDGAFFLNTHTMIPTTRGPKITSATIQDEQMKITILADWETSVTSTGEGVMEVVIQKRDEENSEDASLRKVRVIIEELAAIHDKMTEFYPSHFGKLMTKDFVDPLGVYFSDS
ncbi:MAG: hypothetical protein SGILL_002738 [Bacillariaceae sp.]